MALADFIGAMEALSEPTRSGVLPMVSLVLIKNGFALPDAVMQQVERFAATTTTQELQAYYAAHKITEATWQSLLLALTQSDLKKAAAYLASTHSILPITPSKPTTGQTRAGPFARQQLDQFNKKP